MSTPRDTASLQPLATHGPPRAWAAVAVLALVGTLNYVDRFLPGVLAEPIKQDLALSDTAIGVINGFGFLIVYAVLGIVIARVADRGIFGAVIAGCLTLWGSMTMLGAPAAVAATYYRGLGDAIGGVLGTGSRMSMFANRVVSADFS